MSRHYENCQATSSQRGQLRRVQTQRRNTVLNERKHKSNAKALRKFKKSLRLQYLNSPRATRQSLSAAATTTNTTANDTRDMEEETTTGTLLSSRHINPRSLVSADEQENGRQNSNACSHALRNRRSLRNTSNSDASMELETKIKPSAKRGRVCPPQRRQSSRLHAAVAPERIQPRNPRTLSNSSSSEDEYETAQEYDSDDDSLTSASGGLEAPRRMLRSARSNQEETSIAYMTRLQEKSHQMNHPSEESDRRITRSSHTDLVETTDDSEASMERYSRRCTTRRTCTPPMEVNRQQSDSSRRITRNTRHENIESDATPVTEPLNDSELDVSWHRRRSVRVFLKERPMQDQDTAPAEPPVDATLTRNSKAKVALVEEEPTKPSGRSKQQHASKRQLFGKIASANPEEMMIRRGGRTRKAPNRFQVNHGGNDAFQVDDCPERSNRKRDREETTVPTRRSSRITTPVAKKPRCLRSTRSQMISPESSNESIDEEEPRAAVVKKTLDQTPKQRRSCRGKSVSTGDFMLDYVQLIEEYEALASCGEVKRVRFGPTIETAQAAVERSIRMYENRSLHVDQDILADEKQHRKSLKSHPFFELQERQNIIEDLETEEENDDDNDAEEAMELMEELADTPILLSDHVSIRTRRSQCKDCPLCLPHAQNSVSLKRDETTITPCIASVNGFELNDGIVKNTLNTLMRLRHSLAFVKEHNGL